MTWRSAPGGDVYLTDSGIEIEEVAPNGQLNPDYRKLKYDGRVFRIDPRTRAVQCIDRGLQFTNGIAFGPDGHLYIAETLSGNIYRYDMQRTAGSPASGSCSATSSSTSTPPSSRGPDGMKFGADGNLYVASSGRATSPCSAATARCVRRIKVEGSMPDQPGLRPRRAKRRST